MNHEERCGCGLMHMYAVDERHSAALKIWLKYFVETETFDRTLPGFFFCNDEWMPAATHRHLSMQFARTKRVEAVHALALAGLDEEVSERARLEAVCMSYQRQRRELGDPDYEITADARLVRTAPR